MKEYLNYLSNIMENGVLTENRTGVKTKSLVGLQMRFDLQKGFPLLTTKQVSFTNIATELEWFIKGGTNIKFLVDRGVNIWNEDAYRKYINTPVEELETQFVVKVYDKNMNFLGDKHRSFESFKKCIKEYEEDRLPSIGELGPIYGYQWRRLQKTISLSKIDKKKKEKIQEEAKKRWSYLDGDNITIVYDQLGDIVRTLKTDPNSRRMILNAWNPLDIEDMSLPPCHFASQYIVHENKINCVVSQRSADSFLGVPYNIASYALLVHILAQVSNKEVGELVWNGGDCHIYENHFEQVKEQLLREPKKLPELSFKRRFDLDLFQADYVELKDYKYHPKIKGKLSAGVEV